MLLPLISRKMALTSVTVAGMPPFLPRAMIEARSLSSSRSLRLHGAGKTAGRGEHTHVRHRLVHAPLDQAVDGRGRAAYHHQLQARHRQAVVHSHLRAGHAALFSQHDHLRIVDKAEHLRALVAQEIHADVICHQRGVCDDRASHINQAFDVRQRSRAEINTLRQGKIARLLLDRTEDIRHFLIEIWDAGAMPTVGLHLSDQCQYTPVKKNPIFSRRFYKKYIS